MSWKAIVVTTFSYIVTYGVVYAFFGISGKEKNQTDSLASVSIFVGAFSGTAAISGIPYGLSALIVAMSLSLLVQTIALSLFYPINGIGIWLRTLFIRLVASLRYFLVGIQNLPMNWYRVCWCNDITHPPELLPRAEQVHEELSVKGLIKLLKSGNTDSQVIAVIFLPILYISALLWRLSLKSTLWLWWPLVLIFKKPIGANNLYEVRSAVVTIVSGYWKWFFLPFIIAIPWLINGYFPQITSVTDLFLSEQQSKALKLLINYAVPELFSCRYLAIALVSFTSIIVWWKANNINTHFPMIIGDETYATKIESNSQYWQQKIDFQNQAKSIARWHSWRIVSFILLGYSYILYLAYQWYPEETSQYIADWLLKYL